MPTYEFKCPDGHDFEKFYRSIGSAPVEVVCPICGKVAERRLSGAGLVFKGSGFYITDYGKDGKKDQQAARASSGEANAGEASAASPPSSESKSGVESKSSGDGSAPKAPEAAAPASAPKPTPAPKTSE